MSFKQRAGQRHARVVMAGSAATAWRKSAIASSGWSARSAASARLTSWRDAANVAAFVGRAFTGGRTTHGRPGGAEERQLDEKRSDQNDIERNTQRRPPPQ